jgi:Protein of unknown function (DUF3467)
VEDQADGGRMNDEVLQIELPDDLAGGNYADFASVWHTPNVFVLDFVAVKTPPQEGVDANGNKAIVVPGRVVSRIRIPPEQVFEVAKALTRQLETWEQETGRREPSQPLFGISLQDPTIKPTEGDDDADD